MNPFDRANESLRHDLSAYARALRTIVMMLPRARTLCDHVVKETRLAHALLAFASGPQIAELSQLAFHLSNLWPYRDRLYPQTVGFDEEIAEARRQREEALRGARMMERFLRDGFAVEIRTCFLNMANYLEEEQRILEESHVLIQPHAKNLEITRKRLHLLIAAADARLPESPEQRVAVRAYTEAADLLRDWENGVPLDEQGIDILERCLTILDQTDNSILAYLSPGQPQGAQAHPEPVGHGSER